MIVTIRPLSRNGDLVVAMGNHSFIFEQQGQILAKIFSKVEIKDVLCKLGSTNFYLGSLWFAIARAARPVSPRAGMVAWPLRCLHVSWAASMHGHWDWIVVNLAVVMWRFRKIGAPPVIIHLSGILPTKNQPAIGDPPWNPPYFGTAQVFDPYRIPWDNHARWWGGLGITDPSASFCVAHGPTPSHVRRNRRLSQESPLSIVQPAQKRPGSPLHLGGRGPCLAHPGRSWWVRTHEANICKLSSRSCRSNSSGTILVASS